MVETHEHCCACDAETGHAGRGEDSLYCPECEEGPFCNACYNAHMVGEYEVLVEELRQENERMARDNDGLLSEAEMHRVYDVAVAVNALDARLRRVEALRRQFEQHIAAEDGADPPAGESVNVLDLDAIESRAHRLMVATWECDKHSHNDQWQMVRCDVPALVAAVRSLRAERDAAQARVVELEADNASMREDAVLAMLIRRMPKDSSLKRTSFQTWLYRSGPLKWGAGGTPKEALEAALGEKGTDGR